MLAVPFLSIFLEPIYHFRILLLAYSDIALPKRMPTVLQDAMADCIMLNRFHVNGLTM
jgi:hypothetical protein